MKKILACILFFSISLSIYSQKKIYKNPNLEEISRQHKTIGIIPFNASILLSPAQRKEFAQKELDKAGTIEEGKIQSSLYSWFLKKEIEQQLNVKIQDFSITHSLLLKAGITSKNYSRYSPSELAKKLDVDAIIQIGVFEGLKNTNISFFIYNSEDGQLLLKFDKDVSASVDPSTSEFIDTFMKKPSKNIVYTN